MTATDELAEWWVHECTVETYEGDGAYGPVYAEPVTVACFIDGRERLVRTPNGDQVASNTTVYAALADADRFAPESRVTVREEQRTVGSVAARDAGGLGLPEHTEAVLI